MTEPKPVNPLISSAHLLRFTNEQGLAAPRRVRVTPAIGAKVDHCYVNVEQAVERAGGVGIYGWKILEFPRLFLQAIHHAVWLSKDVRLVDVTPDIRNWRQVVFAPDEALMYRGIPPDTIRPRFLNISGLTEIDDLIGISLKLTELRIQSALPNGAMLPLDKSNRGVAELISQSKLLFEVARFKIGAK